MGKYRPPVCSSGHPLTVYTEMNVAAGVRNDGKPHLNRITIFKHEPYALCCLECKERFNATLDDKGRVIRGRKYEEGENKL